MLSTHIKNAVSNSFTACLKYSRHEHARSVGAVCYNSAGMAPFTIIRQVVFVGVAGLDSFPTSVIYVHAEFLINVLIACLL